MKKALVAIIVMIFALITATCERSDFFDMAYYGAPENPVIYLFPINSRAGNLGGRSGADNLCYNEGSAYLKLVNAYTVKAFLSVSSTDEMRFLVPSEFWYYPVIGVSSMLALTPISANWPDLMNGILINSINSAVGLGASYWWSGSSFGGAVNGNNCSNWKDNSAGLGELGGVTVDSSNAGCVTPYPVLCVAY